jgi:hypothetical protein
MTVLHCCTMLTRLRRRGRFLLFVFVPLVLFGCAEMASLFSAAAPALAQVGAKAFEAAIDDAEKQTKKPPTDPQITKLRKRVAVLEAAEKKEALERAKERAADLRALTVMAKEIASLRSELADGIDALRRSAPVDGGAPVDAGSISIDGGAP